MSKKELVLSDKLAPMRERMTYSHAIKVGNTIYVSGLWDLRKMVPAFRKYFGDHVPTMTAVEIVQLWHPHILVECEAVAVVGEDQVIIDGKEIEGVKYGKRYTVPNET